MDNCLGERCVELLNGMLRMLVCANSVLKALYFFVFFYFFFWQWLVLGVVQPSSPVARLMMAKLSINSRQAPMPTLHAYAYGWPQTSTQRK